MCHLLHSPLCTRPTHTWCQVVDTCQVSTLLAHLLFHQWGSCGFGVCSWSEIKMGKIEGQNHNFKNRLQIFLFLCYYSTDVRIEVTKSQIISSKYFFFIVMFKNLHEQKELTQENLMMKERKFSKKVSKYLLFISITTFYRKPTFLLKL